MAIMNDSEQVRGMIEQAAAILHNCELHRTNCAKAESCTRDRAYIADIIEQEVGTPMLAMLDAAEKQRDDARQLFANANSRLEKLEVATERTGKYYAECLKCGHNEVCELDINCPACGKGKMTPID